VSKRSDWWYDVEVNTHLFSEEEVEDILDKNVVFAVDYKLPRGRWGYAVVEQWCTNASFDLNTYKLRTVILATRCWNDARSKS